MNIVPEDLSRLICTVAHDAILKRQEASAAAEKAAEAYVAGLTAFRKAIKPLTTAQPE